MSKINEVRERYLQGFVTDAQLKRYFELNVISEEVYNELFYFKHPELKEIEEEIIITEE